MTIETLNHSHDGTPFCRRPNCGAKNAVVETGVTASQPGLLPAPGYSTKFRVLLSNRSVTRKVAGPFPAVSSGSTTYAPTTAAKRISVDKRKAWREQEQIGREVEVRRAALPGDHGRIAREDPFAAPGGPSRRS